MNIILQREVLSDESTIGQIVIDGEHVCFTLEDVIRKPGVKIYGKTAIPVGRYRVIVNESKRFQKMLPLLVGVPGFEGIRIHAGNTSEDTDGCILVGLQKGVNSIGRSRAAMEKLRPLIQEALDSGEDCWIDLRNPPALRP